MLNRAIATLGLLGVAACGGSGGSGGTTSPVEPAPATDPISDSGFATASSAVVTGESFDAQSTFRLLGDSNGNIVVDEQDVEYTISQDGSTVTVVLEGETYVLTQTVSGYSFAETGTQISATRIYAPTPVAEIVDVLAVIDNELNDASFVIGFDTNPTQVAAQTGTAQMQGEIFVTARNGFDRAFGSGDITLDVDFNEDTLSGDFTLQDDFDFNSSFAIPTSSYELEETAIVADGFSGDISLTSGDINGSITRAEYNGRFYGANAIAAGGQIIAEVDEIGQDDPTFIEGAFIAVD